MIQWITTRHDSGVRQRKWVSSGVGEGLRCAIFRSFSQFFAIFCDFSQFPAIFRYFLQFFAIFCVFSAIACCPSPSRACWCPVCPCAEVLLLEASGGLITVPQFFRNFSQLDLTLPNIHRP